jgi:hypothetical protein
MFRFGSAAFTWNDRKIINYVEGSTNIQFWKWICHVKVLEKLSNHLNGSTCFHNGKYIYSLSEVQKSSIICKTNNGIIRENERKYNNNK